MKINRQIFLGVLKHASAALSSNKNQVEELSHFWFDGKYLSAFDDILGIRIAFETEFKGGVKGDKLLGILDNSRAKDVTITQDDDKNLLMKIGAARVKLAFRPIEDWFWKPDLPEDEGVLITDEFLKGIELTLLSVGTSKVMNAEQRGITIIKNGGGSDLYSTDAVTISWIRLQSKYNFPARVILSTPFCEQIKKFVKVGSKLCFDENAVYCSGDIFIESLKSDFLLFSRLVEDENPVNFEEVISGYVKNVKGFNVPSRLELLLNRALVMLSDGEPAELEIKDSKLYIFAQTSLGEIDDVVKLEKAEEHIDITVNIDPALLKRGFEGREFMTVTKDCLVMTGPGDFYHIIATK